MHYEIKEHYLTIVADDDDLKHLRELANEESFDSDETLYDLFEDMVANSELEWVQPEWIGALTSAPILGITGEACSEITHGSFAGHWDDKTWYHPVLQAWAFMDYQVVSLQQQLLDHGKVELTSGLEECSIAS